MSSLSIHFDVSVGAPSKRVAGALDYQVKLAVSGPHLQVGGSVYSGEVTLIRDARGRMAADCALSLDGWCSAGLLAAIVELPGDRPSSAVVACLRAVDSADGVLLEFDDEPSLGYPKARAAGEDDAGTFMALHPRSEWENTVAVGGGRPSCALLNRLCEVGLVDTLGVVVWMPDSCLPTDEAVAAFRSYDEAWREAIEMALDSEAMEDSH